MPNLRRVSRPLALSAVVALAFAPRPATAGGFERVVIDDNFPGAYQVEVADVNGDGKPDVIAVGGGTCAWYENPSWTKRVVTGPKQTPGIISSATADLDGDGKAEIAIAYEFAMNEPKKGKLLLARQGKGADDPWTVEHVDDIASIHRLRWLRLNLNLPDREKKARPVKLTYLVVAPIFGPSARPPTFDQEPAHLVMFATRADPKPMIFPTTTAGEHTPYRPQSIGDAPVLHAIDVVGLDGPEGSIVLGASNLGVTWFNLFAIMGAPRFKPEALAPGAPGVAPKRGASEVHLGRLKDGRRFLATVEPWHGTEVAVYLSDKPKSLTFGKRTVIDSTLKEGHALWVADVDGDGDDEVFAGYRGAGTSVLAFDFNGKTWDRSVVDDAIAAQDLRGGDLDGNGIPDVVAVGGRTHNVVWYRPRPAAR